MAPSYSMLRFCRPLILEGPAALGDDRCKMFSGGARLRARAETRSIPVIAVSAQAMRGDRERAIEAGCVDYVTKPVARGELVRL